MSAPHRRITSMEVAAPARLHSPVDMLDHATGVMAAASAEALRAVAACDEMRVWWADGATSMTSWLAARYGLAWGTAREWVRVAQALQSLPRIAEAYRCGWLSWDQLRPLTRFATPETDQDWATKGPELRPAALWWEARRHERVLVREAQEIHRERFLRLNWDHLRPVLWLEGMLPAEEGAALESALCRRAGDIVRDPDAADPAGARLADALVEQVTAGDEGQAAPTTLVVHAGAEILGGEESMAGPWLAETESGHRLPTDTIRRLACDSRVEWVLESEGRPVGIGRRGRQVPEPIHRVLRHRDGGVCRFPGCERKRWLNAHHLVHWADGGATNLDNLVLLCHAHHRLIHEGGWRTSGHPAHDLRFHYPGGRPLRRSAFPEMVAARPP
jgi:Domain of unknown function (DUF222)/HNH endonuclease